MPDAPLILCYDGSEDAKHAIERGGELLAARRALVLTVWLPDGGPRPPAGVHSKHGQLRRARSCRSGSG